jgi:hypothetical protein
MTRGAGDDPAPDDVGGGAPHDTDGPPEAPPDTVPVDPHGEGPANIPDPMPDDLQRTERADEAFEESQPMEGEAPTG